MTSFVCKIYNMMPINEVKKNAVKNYDETQEVVDRKRERKIREETGRWR